MSVNVQSISWSAISLSKFGRFVFRAYFNYLQVSKHTLCDRCCTRQARTSGLEKLKTHTIVAGATGGGKTVAAQDIAEEALKHNTAVIVFDPTAQWTGLLKKCQDKTMLRLYEKFGMKRKDAKGFKGTIHFITKPTEILNLNELMKEGEANIYVINNLRMLK